MAVDFFLELTWSDLESWAGPRIVTRGRSYQRSGRVKELGRTTAGELLAWVDGSERYATLVTIDERTITSSCTCPYGVNCKHAVALVLECLELLKNKKTIPLSSEKDKRLDLIRKDDGIFIDGKTRKDLEFQRAQKPYHEIRSYLNQQPKKDLVEFFLSMAHRHPEIYSELHNTASLHSGKISSLVESISRDIELESAEPAFWNHWESRGYIPDYSRILTNLRNLLDEGYDDEVVSLGEKLFRSGKEQLMLSDDEGETGSQIAECMTIVFKALQRCSLSDVKKILCALNFQMVDDYNLCNGLDEFWKKRFKKADWSIVADKLIDRLHRWKPGDGVDSFSRDFNRDLLTNTIIHALENAGRGKEIIPLAMEEASKTNSYERLVGLLRQESRIEEAEEWIRNGFAATKDKLPGIASHLRKQLLEIRTQESDWNYVAAIRAEEFFENPSLYTYKELRKASEEAGVWPEVGQKAVLFLETGKQPEGMDGSKKSGERIAWPLPAVGLGKKGARASRFPNTKVLLEIAIYEKRMDDILKWYDIHSQKNQFSWDWEGRLDDKVANVVVKHYPDKAITIWKKLADSHIARKKLSGYIKAAEYIRKIQEILKKEGRSNEWASYLAKLRVENARKRRLLEILDSISGKPIIELKNIPLVDEE